MCDPFDLKAALDNEITRHTNAARGDYAMNTHRRLRQVTAERDQLARRVLALSPQSVRRQEEVHNSCEGHALCDLVSSVEAIQRSLNDPPDGGDAA